jgi:hypothetical protein
MRADRGGNGQQIVSYRGISAGSGRQPALFLQNPSKGADIINRSVW